MAQQFCRSLDGLWTWIAPTPVTSGRPRPGTARPRIASRYTSAKSRSRPCTWAHYRQLVGLARLILGANAAAEDIVQEAFIRVYGSWSKIRDPDRAAGYLRSTTINLARSVLRRQQTALRYAPDPPAEPAGPEEQVLAMVRNAGVLDALRLLPWRQQQVIMLRYYADLSVLETARTLQISTGTVKTHGFRALATLSEALQGH
jgi:RNA polymerase sigma-70 factor (sigma-E family)